MQHITLLREGNRDATFLFLLTVYKFSCCLEHCLKYLFLFWIVPGLYKKLAFP